MDQRTSAGDAPGQRGCWRWASLAALMLAAAVLLAPVRQTESDPELTLLTARALVEHGSSSLDRYWDRLDARTQAQAGWKTFRDHRDRARHDVYPIGTAVAAMPAVAGATWLGLDVTRGDDNARLQMALAACCAFATLLLLWRLARCYLGDRRGLALAGALAFGSSLASTCGTALWSFDLEVVLQLAVLGSVAKWERQRTVPLAWSPFWVGILLGLAFVTRPTSLATAAVVLAWSALVTPRALPRTVAGIALPVLALAAFSWHDLGRMLPPYFLPGRWPRASGAIAAAENLAALLLSPARGLFVFTPLLAVAFFGLGGRSRERLPWLAFGGFAIELGVLSWHENWWGGWCFGPRLLTDAVPLLAIPLAGGVGRLLSLARRRVAVRVLLVVLAVSGVAIHTGRGLYAPVVMAWNDQPNIDQASELYRWSFRFSQLLATPSRNAMKARAFDATMVAPLPAADGPAERGTVLSIDEFASWLASETFDLARDDGSVRLVAGEARRLPAGLEVRPDEGDTWLELDLGCPSGDVDRIVVSARGDLAPSYRLYWTTVDRGWHPEQRMDAHGDPAGRGVFDVGSHPAWHGPIAQLRLGILRRAGSLPVVLDGLIASRIVPDRDRLEALDGSQEIAIGSEVRAAEPLLPGRPRKITATDIGPDTTLSAGAGRVPGTRTAACVRVVATARGADPCTLVETCLPPELEDWRDLHVALGSLAGREAEISFESCTPAGADAEGALWLASPEVVGHGTGGRVNVLLISIDTLRQDGLSLHGARPGTSPTIDRLARERAVVFSQAIAQAPWTLPSHTSIFTGRDATRHGINQYGRTLPTAVTTLAERFHDAGYATAAVTGGGAVHPRYGLAQGFQRYAYFDQADHDGELDWEIDRALAWLDDNADRPFFLFLHTYEVHDPYRERQPWYTRLGGRPLEAVDAATPIRLHLDPPGPEDGWLGRDHEFRWSGGPRDGEPLTDDEIPIVRDRYESEVAHVDARLGEILELLGRRGVAARTVVALVSDHGEALGEDGHAGHGYLIDSNLRVPMIVALPGGTGAGTTVDAQVRLVDLAPTLLEVAGLEPLPGIEGRSLLPLVEGRGGGPREAYSYAAAMNRGLALRLPGRGKIEFNDTAWSQLVGKHALTGLGDDGRALPGPPDAASQAELLARVGEELSNLAGFHVALASPANKSLQFELRVPRLGPTMVKAVRGAALTLEFVLPHSVRVALEAGRRQELVLDVPARGWLDVVPAPASTPACRLALQRGVRHARLEGGRLVAGEGPLPPAAAGVEIAWVGDEPATADDPTLLDPALADRLRALGYAR